MKTFGNILFAVACLIIAGYVFDRLDQAEKIFVGIILGAMIIALEIRDAKAVVIHIEADGGRNDKS